MITNALDITYIKYTIAFLGLMLLIYGFVIFGSMLKAPTFAYAAF